MKKYGTQNAPSAPKGNPNTPAGQKVDPGSRKGTAEEPK